MDNLEKLIFLEITNKQFTKFPDAEYFATYEALTKREQNQFSLYSNEIHNIWNYINAMPVENVIDNVNINSVNNYNNSVNQISELILKTCNDFKLNLKDEIIPEFKESVIRVLGHDFYKRTFER
jgi:hypothetical protein